MKEFKGRGAVITGAASDLGRKLANRAAALGVNLALADVQHDALDRRGRNSRRKALRCKP